MENLKNKIIRESKIKMVSRHVSLSYGIMLYKFFLLFVRVTDSDWRNMISIGQLFL